MSEPWEREKESIANRGKRTNVTSPELRMSSRVLAACRPGSNCRLHERLGRFRLPNVMRLFVQETFGEFLLGHAAQIEDRTTDLPVESPADETGIEGGVPDLDKRVEPLKEIFDRKGLGLPVAPTVTPYHSNEHLVQLRRPATLTVPVFLFVEHRLEN